MSKKIKAEGMEYFVKDNKTFRISKNVLSNNGYDLCIGLEVHAQIKSNTKLFSRAKVHEFDAPNTNVDYLDLGLPGALPIVNREAVLQGLRTSIALNMKINSTSVFDRKHYFYQDSPLGYQITQFFKPIGYKGYLNCSFGRININRLHIESDAGKSIYNNDGSTNIDLNRLGVGLMEIVTEPDFESVEEVIEYLKELRAILIEIDSSNADMEKGNFRVDVNISVNKTYKPLGTRVEIKNLNSFQNIKKAIEYEFALQKKTLESGLEVEQATKLFDVDKNETKTIRSKEDFIDYNYFPDPDLLPIHFSEQEINEIRKKMPKLPSQYREEYEDINLTTEQINIILESKARNQFIQNLKKTLSNDAFFYAIKVFCSDLLGWLSKNNLNFEDLLLRDELFSDKFIQIILLTIEEKITKSNSKKLLAQMLDNTSKSIDEIIDECGYLNKINFDLDTMIEIVLKNSPNEVAKYKSGNDKILMFFVGVIMKQTKGQIEPESIKQKIITKINGAL